LGATRRVFLPLSNISTVGSYTLGPLLYYVSSSEAIYLGLCCIVSVVQKLSLSNIISS